MRRAYGHVDQKIRLALLRLQIFLMLPSLVNIMFLRQDNSTIYQL